MIQKNKLEAERTFIVNSEIDHQQIDDQLETMGYQQQEGCYKKQQLNSKKQSQGMSAFLNQMNSEKLINFQEVINQNLSCIYQTIAINPSDISEKDNPNNKQNKTQPRQQPNSGLLLPISSNLKGVISSNISNLNLKKNSPPKNPQLRLSHHMTENHKEKQNKVKVVSPLTEKHVRIKSEKVIQYFSQEQIQSSDLEERNPESSFYNVKKLLHELSRQFQYVGDFSIIRKHIVELSLSKKYIVMQNTNQFVTIKVASKLNYCQCLLKSCLSLDDAAGGIYQLKNSLYKRKKAKFTLISGNQKYFLKFFRQLLIQLWKNKELKLKQNNLVQFFFNVQKEDDCFKKLKKQYKRLYNEFSGLSDQKSSNSRKTTAKFFISGLTQNIKRLWSPQKIKNVEPIQKQFQLKQFNKNVNSKFNELRSRLVSAQNLPNFDQQTLKKQMQAEFYFHQFPVWKLFGFYHQIEFQEFTNKKEEIVKKYSLRRIFSYLQIQEQYGLLTIQKGRLQMEMQKQTKKGNSIKSSENLYTKQQDQTIQLKSSLFIPVTPYDACIQMLQSLNAASLTPTKFLTSLVLFYKQMQVSYSGLYSQKPILKLSSMDDQLPVTIFILLMAELSQGKNKNMEGKGNFIRTNFLGKLRWVGKWVEDQQLRIYSKREINFERKEVSNAEESTKIGGNKGYEVQRKVLTMLQAAFEFILKQWNIEENDGLTQAGQIMD